MTVAVAKLPTARDRFRAAKKAYFALLRAETTTLPEFPKGHRWTQVLIKIHPSMWYLLPFTTNADVPGLYHVTWLCVTLRITWKVQPSPQIETERLS